MSIPEQSEDGRWQRGQTFVPPEGPCEGHMVAVVNPSVMLTKTISKSNQAMGRTTMDSITGELECVYVRCTEDFRSWHFPALAEFDEPLAAMYRRVYMKMVGERDDE